jgi:hypothetical protein
MREAVIGALADSPRSSSARPPNVSRVSRMCHDSHVALGTPAVDTLTSVLVLVQREHKVTPVDCGERVIDPESLESGR